MNDPPLVLHFFAVAALGGSELGALEYLRAQPALRHRLLFLVPRGPANDLYEAAGFATANLDLGRQGGRAVWRSLGRFLAEHHPDLVHTYGLRPSLLMRLRRSRPPLVQSIHSLDEHRPAWQAWLDRATAARVDRYIANSAAGARFIVSRRGVPADRVRVVENGIDVARYARGAQRRDAMRAALGIAADEPAILTLANLRAPKGFDLLIEVARDLQAAGRRFVWLIAGSGPDEAWLRGELARGGLETRVRLLGFRRDVPELLAAADLFCLTSRREGVPVAIVEAMAAGVPVVATGVGGVAELVEDGATGRVVEPRAAPLAAAVRALLDDPPLRARLGARGRQRAHARYAAARAAREIAAVYQELLARR
jgi:glycosyltransferase involved in cell wall biosynthesis